MSWPSATLGSVATIDRLSVQPSGASGRYIGLDHINSDGTINVDHGINAEDLTSSKFSFTPSHILFGKLRPYLRKVARPSFPGICSTDILPIHPNKGVDKDYLFHYLRTPGVIDLATARSSGANLPRISPRILSEFLVPVPPLEEQKRIAAILDKADAIGRKREQAIKLADEFLRSLFLDRFGDPVNNPKGWPVMSFGEVLLDIEAGTSVSGEQRARNLGEKAVLKISAVTSGTFNPNESKVVDAASLPPVVVIPKKGDLLFSRANTRELVGATCLVHLDDPDLFLPDKIWRLLCAEELASPVYIHYVLSNDRFRKQLTKIATGTSGSMLNISQQKLLHYQLPVPPLSLQQLFTKAWESTTLLRQRLLQFGSEAVRLQSCLTSRAFRGTP